MSNAFDVEAGDAGSPGDNLNTTLLKAGPARLLYVGCDLSQLIGRELSTPVSLDGLFDFTIGTCGDGDEPLCGELFYYTREH